MIFIVFFSITSFILLCLKKNIQPFCINSILNGNTPNILAELNSYIFYTIIILERRQHLMRRNFHHRAYKTIQNILLFTFSILIWILGGVFLHTMKENKALAVQQGLAEEVVRFHVIANSDSQNDQALKLLVKNAVLEYMSEPLARCNSAQEALQVLEENTVSIIRIAKKVVRENGYDYSVTASIEDIYFPEKSYGDVNFPEGIYTAYRIIIGKGEGANWWCVLYPPLCFLDITHGVLPEASKEVLKQALTEEEYSAITNENWNPDRVKIEFKLLPFLNDFIS